MALLNTPKKFLYSQGNAQIIVFNGLTDAVTGLPIDLEVLEATMIDWNGNQVPGCIAIPLNNTDLLGDYLGTFGDDSFYPDIGTGYTLLIDGDDGSGGGAIHFEVMVEIVARQQ
jgi:hypothetical protein